MPEGSNWVLRKCYAFKSLEKFFFLSLFLWRLLRSWGITEKAVHGADKVVI